jgi:DNA-binding CsgD family transcriptional regulator
MLDLIDTHPARAAELLAVLGGQPAQAFVQPVTAVPAATQRPRGYAGPERRGAAALPQQRMAQMLDTLDYGMLLLTDTLRVAHVNKAARRDMDEQHPLQLAGLPLTGLQLQARVGRDVLPLREALVGAAQRGLRRLLQLGEGPHRVSVAVVPLPALGADEQPGAVVLLGKRQMCEELTVDWFARSHGLTMAETAVMKGLCADYTPQAIAERQGVGLATIRTQIGSIRLKTGACSIRALVRQVALLPPLVSALHSAPAAAADSRGSVRVLHS